MVRDITAIIMTMRFAAAVAGMATGPRATGEGHPWAAARDTVAVVVVAVVGTGEETIA